MPIPLSRFRFCYVDTEYTQPDYTDSSLDKCDPGQIELHSIQYVDFFLRRLNVKNLPELKELVLQPGEDEYIPLKTSKPTWKRFFKKFLDKKRLIPHGFIVRMDFFPDIKESKNLYIFPEINEFVVGEK